MPKIMIIWFLVEFEFSRPKIVNIQRYLHKLMIFSAKIQMIFLRFFGAAEAI